MRYNILQDCSRKGNIRFSANRVLRSVVLVLGVQVVGGTCVLVCLYAYDTCMHLLRSQDSTSTSVSSTTRVQVPSTPYNVLQYAERKNNILIFSPIHHHEEVRFRCRTHQFFPINDVLRRKAFTTTVIIPKSSSV